MVVVTITCYLRLLTDYLVSRPCGLVESSFSQCVLRPGGDRSQSWHHTNTQVQTQRPAMDTSRDCVPGVTQWQTECDASSVTSVTREGTQARELPPAV